MRNRDVARIFRGLADLLELKGESRFKVRAYRKVADTIEDVSAEVAELAAQGRLRDIPGVGEAIEKKITEIVTTGKLSLYDKVKSEFPEGIMNLLDVPGVGPKTALALASEPGIKSVAELKLAIASGKVAQLPGMGEKSAHNILRRIKTLKETNVP